MRLYECLTFSIPSRLNFGRDCFCVSDFQSLIIDIIIWIRGAAVECLHDVAVAVYVQMVFNVTAINVTIPIVIAILVVGAEVAALAVDRFAPPDGRLGAEVRRRPVELAAILGVVVEAELALGQVAVELENGDDYRSPDVHLVRRRVDDAVQPRVRVVHVVPVRNHSLDRPVALQQRLVIICRRKRDELSPDRDAIASADGTYLSRCSSLGPTSRISLCSRPPWPAHPSKSSTATARSSSV